jgi:aminopeptidase
MESFIAQQEKYAELVLKVGLNLQPGQPVLLQCPIELLDYGRILVKKAYEAGAERVHVEWVDEEVKRITLENSAFDYLEKPAYWRASVFDSLFEAGGALLQVYAPNPDLLNGIDIDRSAALQKSESIARHEFRNHVQNGDIHWCLTAAPTMTWARKVFPDLSAEHAIEKLWQQIFYMARVDRDDPVAVWKQHLKTLKEKVQLLNQMNLKSLHYQTAEGTDLTIELPDGHLWLGGAWEPPGNGTFVPNIPTEEVFTLPHRDGVNGVVRATLPLNYNGTLIENFSFTFKDGRIVDFNAEAGYDSLKQLVETDEGSHYLGEVALVPDDSPISNLRQIFFNTLFDENASCHLAIGSAYPTTIQNGTEMSRDDLLTRGVNSSLQHVDFMVGSASLDIDGVTQDGQTIAVFRNGNWSI